MNKAVAFAIFALAVAWTASASAEAVGKGPSYFLDGTKNPTLLKSIRAGVAAGIDFNGHFSRAYVSCGVACGSYWFVDRQTGGVAEVPDTPVESRMIWDVRSRAGSDTIAVTYGPRDGAPKACSTRHFRWSGKSFVALDQPTAAKCPP